VFCGRPFEPDFLLHDTPPTTTTAACQDPGLHDNCPNAGGLDQQIWGLVIG
jgi:hypothetical protein